jgi:hypothetical protein
MAFCSNCGSKIEDGVKFCSACGNPVQSAVPQHRPAPVQTQRQGMGEQVLKEGYAKNLTNVGTLERLNFRKMMNLPIGNFRLYKDRLEWEGDTNILIPINKISSIEFNLAWSDRLKIKLNNKSTYSFYMFSEKQYNAAMNGNLKEINMILENEQESKSWVSAINSAINGRLE